MKKHNISAAAIHEFYNNREWSVTEIADYYRVDRKTILNRMKEYGLERRSMSEASKIREKRKRCNGTS